MVRKRRKEIVSSRVDSALLLHKIAIENNIMLRAFISTSAVGYYGSATTEKIYTEQDQPASDFLASTCRQWEGAADTLRNQEQEQSKSGQPWSLISMTVHSGV